MSLEIRHMVVRSTVVDSDRGPSKETSDEKIEAIREEVLEECRRLIRDLWDGRKER